MARTRRRITIVLLLLTVFVVGIVGMVSISHRMFPRDITDASQYEYVLGLYRKSSYADDTDHFPASVPSRATAVSMYFSHGVLQAPMTIELRYTLPPEELDHLEHLFEAQGHKPRGHMPGDYSPEDFTVLFSEYGPRDHSRGVAVNDASSEVLFWVYHD